MTTRAGAPVLVGIDGSRRSLDAVEVATELAALHHRGVRVVYADGWPPAIMGEFPTVVAPAAEVTLHSQAEALLSDAIRLAEKADPAVTVTGAVISGPPVPALIAESRNAYVVVLGDRGAGGFPALLTGSVAVHLATHGACPVLVVRGEHRPDGPVVVGIDGSVTSVRALDFAVEEASLRGADLVAVHTWRPRAMPGPAAMMPMAFDPPPISGDERRVLAESLAGIADRYPDVRVHREAVAGAAAKVLADWSYRAQLVVVGDRGHGGFTGLLIGSVSQHLIHHAACPVAVIRAHLE